jgi:hypothetical protein
MHAEGPFSRGTSHHTSRPIPTHPQDRCPACYPSQGPGAAGGVPGTPRCVGSGGGKETAFVNLVCARGSVIPVLFRSLHAYAYRGCTTRAVSNLRARHINSLGYVGLSAHVRPFRCQVRKSLPPFLDSLNPVCDQTLIMGMYSNWLLVVILN